MCIKDPWLAGAMFSFKSRASGDPFGACKVGCSIFTKGVRYSGLFKFLEKSL